MDKSVLYAWVKMCAPAEGLFTHLSASKVALLMLIRGITGNGT